MTEEDLEELIIEDDSEDEEEVIARSTLNPNAPTEIMKLQRALISKSWNVILLWRGASN
jgi:hypothetical protein